MNTKVLLLVAILVGLSSATTAMATEFDPNEYDAGTDENEEISDSCRSDGYEDGQNGPFEVDKYNDCGDEEGGDDAYYERFIEGCMDADNTEEVCEQATDAG